ncbi:MAG TPA: ribulose-phosphate 3-epimerase [Polyangiaceae bacterium]|jgi:ribulose-phosphate 3-epimerase|nr:MAG: Ribulose-phosphate 3-epimerase [Deltaproteobacteria bacterium ADurb.Bin207]HNS95727.1 ribulose-phosphate 3-epimerase [Polyangiaceae bacterium]HNZ21194.1 ribulose-phosphate 3-epimerase [Polyangiaceae bacterium]HOD25365.1 ribulose-phosphate 3-epimerase [Polyangiaceae bacterium]HOE48060.1 ribulose-phosphate 3-epimerase [Polyangiaceae bacterium]
MPKPVGSPSGPIVAPSILSADFGRLHDQVQAAEQAGAGWIHVDVMDGHFVPNITIGPLVVRAVRRATQLPVDVHLMVSEPDSLVEAFVDAGADVVTVHSEACVHLQRTLRRIRDLGASVGVALNPHTPETVLSYVGRDIDLVLVMTVNPGFGGQAFLPSVVPKIRALRSWVDEAGLPIVIEVDGGIGPGTAALVARAGARVLVAGSAVFGQPDLRKAIEAIEREARVEAEVTS